MGQVVFRRAVAEDLDAIVGLLADDALGGGREEAGDPGYRAAFEVIERDGNQLLAVAVLDGLVVGTLQISFMPGISLKGAVRGEIEGVRIAGDRRGRGLGRQMVEWAIGRCRERGCRVVQLTTNARRVEAQRFYEQLGFERSHVGFKLPI